MPSNKPTVLPVRPEIKEIARSSLKISKKLSENFRLAAITLWFYDAESAKVAADSIRTFHDQRIRLNQKITNAIYCVATSTNQKGNSIEILQNGSHIVMPYEDYIPPEYIELLDTIFNTRQQGLPVDPFLASSLGNFLATFRPLTAIWTFYHGSDTIAFAEETISLIDRITEDVTDVISVRKLHAIQSKEFYLPAMNSILDLHENLLKIASLTQDAALETSPIEITIAGDQRRLTVFVNGELIELSAAKLRGVAALALLKYDQWFELNEFCAIAFPKKTYNPRGQFDAALRDLKKYPPFGWDGEGSRRRVNGVVIRAVVEVDTIRKFLRS